MKNFRGRECKRKVKGIQLRKISRKHGRTGRTENYRCTQKPSFFPGLSRLGTWSWLEDKPRVSWRTLWGRNYLGGKSVLAADYSTLKRFKEQARSCHDCGKAAHWTRGFPEQVMGGKKGRRNYCKTTRKTELKKKKNAFGGKISSEGPCSVIGARERGLG